MTERKCIATTNVFGFPLGGPCAGAPDEYCDLPSRRYCWHHDPLYAPTEERGEGERGGLWGHFFPHSPGPVLHWFTFQAGVWQSPCGFVATGRHGQSATPVVGGANAGRCKLCEAYTPSPESPAAEETCNGVTPPHDECAGGECAWVCGCGRGETGLPSMEIADARFRRHRDNCAGAESPAERLRREAHEALDDLIAAKTRMWSAEDDPREQDRASVVVEQVEDRLRKLTTNYALAAARKEADSAQD